MKHLMIAVVAADILLMLVLAVAGIETIFNNPTRGCQQFQTGTSWTGYHCPAQDLYSRN